MSWEDRDYAQGGGQFGRPGGDWKGLRPSFENPMSWSLPLFTAGGIRVRIHIIFLIFILVELARALASANKSSSAPYSFLLEAIMLTALFSIVLLHEFGHCIACRRMRGTADEILLWPLGGLAYCAPPNHWRAHFITVIGGPLVNVLLACIFIPLLGALTGQWWGVALPNLFDLYGGLRSDALNSPTLQVLYLINVMNLILLAFNLMPIFPLDGGRMVQSLLWPRVGYVRSMRIAVYTGYIGAIAMGVVGMVMGNWLLITIAIFGGITCYITVKQMAWTEEMMGFQSDEYAQSAFDDPDKKKPSASARRKAEREQRQREKAEARQRAEEAEVDRILAKIRDRGMQSLSAAEKKQLKQATERRKDG